jgi:DNA-binding SARP family transcriptional activator
MALTVQLLGRPTITDEHGRSLAVPGQQAWALLARLLLSDRPVRRREIALELFGDTADPLGSLRWCLASLRRVLGSQALQGDPIVACLLPGTKVDIWDLRDGTLDVEAASDLLDDIEPKSSSEFATWLLIARERIAGSLNERIRLETMASMSTGGFDRAIRLAHLGAKRQPLDEGAHILLAKSLALSGRWEAALEHVMATEAFFLSEVGEKPSPALRSAARRTVAAPPGGVQPRSVVESLLSAGAAALSAGAVDAGLDCLRRAAADAESLRDDFVWARALGELGTALVHSVRGYDDEGAILLRQSAELARRCGDAVLAANSLRELGYVEALAGRRPGAAKILAEALEASGEHVGSLAGVHSVIAFNLADWGREEESLHHYDLALEHARSAGNKKQTIWALGLGGWGLLAAGRPESAQDWLETCLTLCDEANWLSFRPWPVAVHAEAGLKLGRPSGELEADLEGAFALSCHLGDPCWEGATSRSLALAHAARGETEVALKWLSRGRAACARVSDAFAGVLVAIIADQVALTEIAGGKEQADLLRRQLISLAAKTHADGHLRRAIGSSF